MGTEVNLPAFLQDEYPIAWLMTPQERMALVQLLEFVKPPVALEIGTHRGGSLQVLAPRARSVYALDLNPQVPEWLRGRFPNVTFLTGDSQTLLPALLREIEGRGEELGFVLVDGDHTEEGVRRDVNAVLRYTPRRQVYVALHDSFNPDCRAGMLAAEWQACPHVHYLHLDFAGGQFAPSPRGLEMWGGLGLAVLLPEKRTGPLTVRHASGVLFDTAYACSLHAREGRPKPAAA
jgi:hypothetical protein